MDLAKFQQAIKDMQHRLSDLKSQVETNPAQVVDILETALANWQVTLEELWVATEALQEQHDLLVASQLLLKAERQRFFDLFNTAPDCYLVTDSSGVIREANQVASQLLNRRQDYLIGKSLALFIPETEQQIFRNLLHILSHHRTLYNWQLNVQPTRDQHPVPVSINAVTQRQKAAPIRWLLRNLSQPMTVDKIRQQMAGAQTVSAPQPPPVADWQQMLNHTPVILFLLDRDGTIQALNQTAKETTEQFLYRPLMVGDSLKDFLRFEQPAAFEDYLAQVFKQEAVNIQCKLYGRWFYLSYRPVVEEEEVKAVCLTLLEVTAHKEADGEILYQAQILNSISEAVIALTPHSKVLFWNRAAERMYGWTADEALGRSVSELIMPVSAEVDRLPDYSFSLSSLKHYHRDGHYFEVEVRVNEIVDELAPLTNYVAVVRDITTQRTIATFEEQSQAKWAIIELQAVKAELSRHCRLNDLSLACIDHQSRTALNAIFGASDVLQEQFLGPLNQQQIKYHHYIKDSGRQLMKSISEVIELSQIEAGKVTIQFETVSLVEICQNCIDEARPLANQKSLTLKTKLTTVPQEIQADPTRVTQMISQLLTQAITITPEGGEIGLAVQGRASDEQVDLTVWDSGPVLQEPQIVDILSPTVQITDRFRTLPESSYWGLFLTARLSDMHGGRLAVERNSGKGNRFTITLPWRGNANDDAIEEPPMPSTLSATDKLILLAEDNKMTSKLTKSYLQRQGYQVVTAGDGSETLHIAHSVTPDLILMDIQMPKVDGLTVIQQLRQQPAYQKTPIIALTALAMEGDRERCLQTGANDYLSKPILMKELLGHIQQWM